MRLLFALAIKDLRLLWRDKFGMFWVLVFPLLMALFFGSIFGGSSEGARKMTIAIVTDSTAVNADSFYAALSESSAIITRPTTYDSARILVGRGKLAAYVRYRDTATQSFSLFTGSKPAIEVGIDPVRQAEAGYLQGLINQAYFSSMQQTMMNPNGFRTMTNDFLGALDTNSSIPAGQRDLLKSTFGSLDQFLNGLDTLEQVDSTRASDSSRAEGFGPFAPPNITVVDMAVNRTGPRSSWEITFPQSIQWALVGVVASFAIGLVTERQRGTYLRLRVAPLSRAQILIGKGIAAFLAAVITCSLLMTIGVLVFGVRVSSVGWLLAAFGAAGLCFVGLTMLISVLGRTEQAVAGSGWAILLVFSMFGGGMVPLMFLPSWMAAFSSLSPVKWSVLAMEGAIWRGFGAAEMFVPLAVLVGYGLVSYVIGVSILMRRDRS